MGVIDFRARANTPETDAYLRPRIDDIERMGITFPGQGREWYRAPAETIDDFIGRLEPAGIDAVVFVGRNRTASVPDWPLTNDFVAEVAAKYPSQVLAMAGLDATDLDGAPAELHRSVAELGLRGANLDPFQIEAEADDPRFFPVYEACCELGVPLILTFGALPGIPTIMRNGPRALDAVAQRFPDLTLIACHGGWPFTMDMIAVAWRNPNVYFDNSFYHFAPGADVLVQAANEMIGDKMLYASAYPFLPLEQTAESFQALPFTPAARAAVMGGNARRIFGLPA